MGLRLANVRIIPADAYHFASIGFYRSHYVIPRRIKELPPVRGLGYQCALLVGTLPMVIVDGWSKHNSRISGTHTRQISVRHTGLSTARHQRSVFPRRQDIVYMTDNKTCKSQRYYLT